MINAYPKDHFWFAFWFVFSFILNGYATGLPGISLGSFCFIIMIFLSLFKDKKAIYYDRSILKLFIGFSLLSLIDYTSSGVTTSTFVGIAKLIVWLLMINVVCPTFYRTPSIIIWFNRFSVVIITYLTLQVFCFNFLGLYLPNIFCVGPLKPYDAGYADYELLMNATINRPGSFFSESSFCGCFLIVVLSLNLEYSKYFKNPNRFFQIFLSIGVLLSTSTSAILTLGIVWLFYFKTLPKKAKVLLSLLLIAGLVYAVNTGINIESNKNIEYSINKLSQESLESSTRFGKSYSYLKKLTTSELLFGVGMGNDVVILSSRSTERNIYLNSVSSLIAQVGIMGCCMFFLFCGKLILQAFHRKKRMSLCLIVCYLANGFGSGIFFSTFGILFMVVLYADLIYPMHTNYLFNEQP